MEQQGDTNETKEAAAIALKRRRTFTRRTESRRGDRRHYYFGCIGGAIFSAGAEGRAAFAPSFWASDVGVAGSGAGVVGRVPPGFDSAGLSSLVVEGEPCKGGVACASWTLARVVATSEKPVSTSPAASMADAKKNSGRRFRSFDNIIFTHEWFVGVNGRGKALFQGT